jgi:hypothetical protein
MLKHLLFSAFVFTLAQPSIAQDANDSDDRDYLATNNTNSSAAQPVIGLQRKADFVVVQVSFSSDTRDATARKNEIHTMLKAALDQAGSAGFQLNSGNPVLKPITKANYKDLPIAWAGREDTGQIAVQVTVPFTTTIVDVNKRIDAFVKTLPRTGRGEIVRLVGQQLGVRDPKQYRSAIIALIAEDVRKNAARFGPDYRGSVVGLDKGVLWVQKNDSEVFLFLPYSYRIFAK